MHVTRTLTQTPPAQHRLLRLSFSLFVGAALLAASAAAVHAQRAPSAAGPAVGPQPSVTTPAPEEAAQGGSKGEAMAAMQFKWLDANGDGYLSREEVALFPRLRDAYEQADADRDGRVSFAEIRQLALLRRAERKGSAAPDAAAASPSAATPATPVPAPANPPKKW